MRSSGASSFAGDDRFEIIRPLGRGGMGVVLEARDRARDTRVAIKTLPVPSGEGLLRLKREFRALSGIAHPNLVRLEELIESGGSVFFTMELVDGVPLTRWIGGGSVDAEGAETEVESSKLRERRDDRDEAVEPATPAPVPYPREGLSEARLRDGARQLARALVALHREGFVHRDVKPSNVLVTPEGRVVLLDLGLVAGRGDADPSAAPAGTLAYMAPEQADRGPATDKADWYAFGVLLYLAATGRLPYPRRGYGVLVDKQRPAPRASAVAPGIGEDLDALLARLLDPDPDARPTGGEVLRALGEPDASLRDSGLPPPFVGRERELAALARSVARARDGEPVVVVVEGASGTGKSALVTHFAEQLRRVDGAPPVVLIGRCYEHESIAFKGIDSVMDALSDFLRSIDPTVCAALLPRDAALLAGVFPVLRRVTPFARAELRVGLRGGDAQTRRSSFLSAARELFLRLGDRWQLVMVVDDVQWADRDSLRIFAELLRADDPVSLLLVLTARPAEGRVDELSAQLGRPIEVLELDRLSDDEARELARELLPDASVERVESLTREAAGHPLFLAELARYAATAPPASVQLDDVIRARLAALPDGARRVLELASVAGAPVGESTLARATGLDAAELTSAISRLRRERLVNLDGDAERRRVATYHDRIREALVDDLSLERRVEHHRSLARALAAGARSDPERVAVHWRGAGDLETAADHFVRGAERAMADLAFEHAAELFDEAARLRAEDAPALAGRAAHALACAGRPIEAAARFEVAASVPSPRRTEHRVRRAEQLLLGGYVEQGMEAVGELLSEVGTPLPPTPRRALWSLIWQRLKLRLRGTRWRRRDEGSIDPDLLQRLDLYRAVGLGLGVVDPIRSTDFQTRALALALRAGEPGRIAACLAFDACVEAATDIHKLPRARRLLREAWRAQEAADDDRAEPILRAAEGWVAYLGADFEGAVGHLERARAAFEQTASTSLFELDNANLFLAFAFRHLGRYRELGELAASSLRDARRRGDRYAVTCFSSATSLRHLVVDEPARAAAAVERAEWIPLGDFAHVQHWYDLEARAEGALYEGRAAQVGPELEATFEALEGSLLMKRQILRVMASWLRARLLLQAAAGGALAPLAEVRERARRLDREGVVYAEAAAALLYGGLAALEGDREAARAAFERAARVAQRGRLEGHRAAARWRLADLGDEARRAPAEAFFRDQGVKRPDRFVEILAPGVRAV